MSDIKPDLIRMLFLLFCGCSLYTALVTFLRHDNKGNEVFKNLRVPVIVAMYFLIPCVALYLVHKAFGDVRTELFWGISSLLLIISFFIMLYILTMPEWPVGMFLQMHRVPLKIIRYLLSINSAICVLIIGLCSFLVIKVPQAIEEKHGNAFTELQADVEKLELDQRTRRVAIKTIKEEATTDLLVQHINLVTSSIAFGTVFLTCTVSVLALNRRKQSDHE